MKKGIKLEISITQDILNRSSMCQNDYGQNCAIGLAIADIFGKHSWVGENTWYTNNKPINFCITIYEKAWDDLSSYSIIAEIELPKEANDFIKKFDSVSSDHRRKMTPFAFEIDIPNSVIEMISLDEIYKVLETSTCLKLVEA